MDKAPKIALCMHAFREVDFRVFFNLLYCAAQWAKKYEIVFCGKKGLDAATARNALVERAFEFGCTHMLFIDADHLMPPETIDCFMETVGGTSIENDEAIVSGLVCKKGEGFPQVGFKQDGSGYSPVSLPLDGNVHQVVICAFGCTMINMRKLQKLHKPYFRDICRQTPKGEPYNFRSDIVLCEAFNEIGEKCFIDTRVLVGHHGIDEIVYPQTAPTLTKLKALEQDAMKLTAGQKGFYYDA